MKREPLEESAGIELGPEHPSSFTRRRTTLRSVLLVAVALFSGGAAALAASVSTPRATLPAPPSAGIGSTTSPSAGRAGDPTATTGATAPEIGGAPLRPPTSTTGPRS